MEEEEGEGEKDRSFLGRLRDHFTLAGLAEHLKENRDFTGVGEKEQDRVEGRKSGPIKGVRVEPPAG